jgi:hypothetical protein
MSLLGGLKRAGFAFEDACAALPLHPDLQLVEWITEKGLVAGGRELRRIWEKIDTAQPVSIAPDPKRPLFRDLPPPPDYPVDAMFALGKAARALHEVVRAPIALCAQSVLAAATLMIQPHYDVELPSSRRPLTGLFITIAASGERKTSADRRALATICSIETKWREQAEDDQRTYLDEKEAWEAARAEVRKATKIDRAERRRKFGAIGPAPVPPPHPMLLVSDMTPEGIALHLADGRPWCGLFASEGGLIVGGVAFSDESRMRTAAMLNVLWDGEPIRRARVATGRKFLPGRRCSAHLMMQHVVAERLLGDPMLDGIGLLSRMLIVAPETTAGTRLWREPPADAVAALHDYDARLMTFDREPRMCGDALDPLPLTLHADARAMWIAFHDHIELAMGEGGAYAPIRAFAAKMAEHAGRLAAVLAIYADPETVEVPAWAMAGGTELAQHYAAELFRLIGTASVSADLRLAQRLLAWWQARSEPRCHLANIYQRGLNAIGDAATARRIVAVLEEHGWLRRLPGGTVLDGSPRREAWELVP